MSRGEPELLIEDDELYSSRDVQDDTDDIEMRERLGILGSGKVDLVVVLLEEEPLRSDTRLPLESSPYMAGKFYTVDWQLAAAEFPSTPSPAIGFPGAHNISNQILGTSSAPRATYIGRCRYALVGVVLGRLRM